jgi:hypothetical protein
MTTSRDYFALRFACSIGCLMSTMGSLIDVVPAFDLSPQAFACGGRAGAARRLKLFA